MATDRTRPATGLIVRWALFGVFVLVVVGHVVLGWVAANDLIRTWFVPTEAPPAVVSADVAIEGVTYPSPLGTTDAWLVDGTRSEWIIHVHGEDAGPDQALPLVEALAEDGYHQLLINYRNDPGQPADPSGFRRYGTTEWNDLEAALVWAEEQGATEAAVVGYSSGASIAVEHHFKTRSPLVRSLVLDSPILSLGDTVDARASQESLLGVPVPVTVTEFAKFVVGLRISANWPQIDYLSRVDGLNVPSLVLHGTADSTVPIGTSRVLAARRPLMVDLVEFDGAGHIVTASVERDLWADRVRSFLGSRWR